MSNQTAVVRRVVKRVARPVGKFCLVLLVPFVSIQLAISRPLSGGAGMPVGPVADWLDDVIDDLEDAADDLEDAESAVAMPGPLGGRDRADVADALGEVRLIIDRILDPTQYPSLDPPHAGHVDMSADVVSVQDYALECLILVEDALHEAVSPRVDSEAIGTRLRTIEYLMTREGPHNYYSRAGIAPSDQ